MKKLIVYTDGSCQPNPGEGSFGAIILDTCLNPLCTLGGYKKNSTNNKMEAYAFLCTLLTLKEPTDVIFYSDSQYCVNIFNRKWKASKNKELWKRIHSLASQHRCEAKWVKGHSDSKWNLRVDELCDFIRREKKKYFFKRST